MDLDEVRANSTPGGNPSGAELPTNATSNFAPK
jgi:hypothetical protein